MSATTLFRETFYGMRHKLGIFADRLTSAQRLSPSSQGRRRGKKKMPPPRAAFKEIRDDFPDRVVVVVGGGRWT